MSAGPRLTISQLYMTRPGTRSGQAGTSGDNLEIQCQIWLDIDKQGQTEMDRGTKGQKGKDMDREGQTVTYRHRH